MSTKKKLLEAAAGAAGGAGEYVEDVFSTYLYEGDGTNPHTITNGIDLAGEGGLIWTKARDSASLNNVLVDTERATGWLVSNGTQAASGTGTAYLSFNSDGYDIDNAFNNWNGSTIGDYVSWTFRKAPQFFDIVTYTGDGTGTGRYIDHSLGATPGCIIVKQVSATSDWYVWHRSGTNTTGRYCALLNSTASYTDQGLGNIFGSGSLAYTPTSTQVRIGSTLNASGVTYVVYLFAHHDGDGEFGKNADQDIIKCGSFTVSGGAASVDLGFEPQFVISKNISSTGAWFMFDSMRGMTLGTGDKYLRPDLSNAESAGTTNFIDPTPTGFDINNLGSTQTFIYIAIRRPHKPASEFAATDLFATNDRNSTGSSIDIPSGFPVDWFFTKTRDNTYGFQQLSRLQGGGKRLGFYGTFAEQTDPNFEFDHNEKVVAGADSSIGINRSGDNNIDYMFRRASGFFDVVAYTGDGTNGRTVSHNLGVTPEIIIVKSRSAADNWFVYHSATGATKATYLNTASATATSSGFWNDTEPTSSVFSTYSAFTNASSATYIAYLFATVAGISKVGSYTGTGSDVDVACGFTSGARFVLVKRTDSTGDWYVWDSARGIVAGNDPYLLLNSTAAEVTNTDYIDPLSSGFTITSTAPAALNASGGNYIFLAIA